MHSAHIKLVTDQNMHPVAVQIEYQEWLEIAKRLHKEEVMSLTRSLSCHQGTIHLKEDPLDYQKRMRSEWN